MFATAEELWLRWPNHPDIPNETVEVLLQDASDKISGLYNIPSNPSELIQRTLQRVVTSMTRRALTRFGEEGLKSVTDTQGPFSSSLTFSNPEGALFLTKQEREDIEAVLDSSDGDFVILQGEGW
ncbi:hypothetical protein AALI21_02765 [Corynebacteriaceae bacterium 6-324]